MVMKTIFRVTIYQAGVITSTVESMDSQKLDRCLDRDVDLIEIIARSEASVD